MNPSIAYVGAHCCPIVVIDNFCGDVAAVVDVASALAPFPKAVSLYPGLRRPLNREDRLAWRYVEQTVEAVAGFIGRAYRVASFDLLEASFSLVTQPADGLSPLQRIPHYDSINPGYLAILHYLGGTDGTGTAFFKHRSTGIECITRGNYLDFVSAARREAERSQGYINGSDESFEQIAFIPAVPDRLVIYQGNLLHSGTINPDFSFSADPRQGRLTANLFVSS